jgi:hypothetical protein
MWDINNYWDPLEALWVIKWSDPERLKTPPTNLNDEHRSNEFRERAIEIEQIISL